MSDIETIKVLKAENEKLIVENAELKKRKIYGLVWEDKKELFDEQAQNAYPILSLKNDNNYPDINHSSQHNNKNPHILIEGDNYHVLSVLNVTHQKKIDVIYIDPPYNTGNKDFKFNDSFVDKEDRFRHSKWLSFMSKRLKLAKNLLTDDGVIFISIDDNEQANLKVLCDEVFGYSNFITNFIWEKTQHFGRQKINSYSNSDYILCYAKKLGNGFLKELLVEYIKEEHEDAPLLNASNPENILTLPKGSVFFKIPDGTYTASTNNKYELLRPVNVVNSKNIDEVILKFKSRWSQDNVKKELEKGTTFLIKSDGFAVRAIYGDSKTSLESTKQIIFTNKNNEFYTISRFGNEVGTSEKGTKELLDIIGEQNKFEYPKPSSLIEYLLSLLFNYHTSKFKSDLVVLDFFAGSGTTAHAVLELNQQDNGNRQCILVTNNENGICEDITYERVKRVIEGYTTPKGKEIAGLGGVLHYLKTAFVPKDFDDCITDNDKLNLSHQVGIMLALKENTFNEQEKNNFYQIFNSDTKITAIYFNENITKLNTLIEFLASQEKPSILYVYPELANDELDEYSNITQQKIPEPILDIYQNIGTI